MNRRIALLLLSVPALTRTQSQAPDSTTTADKPHPLHSLMQSGLRTLEIHDNALGITFPSLVQYPTLATATNIRIGPYTFEASRDAAIAPGRFPLVLISHGGGGSHLLYRTIATHLAKNGYIVVAPEHPGNNRNKNDLAETDVNSVQRPKHASLTIDALLDDPFFKGSVNEGAIAAIGHSIGGYTVLALAGGQPWSKSTQPLPVKRDSRVKAAVLMAPATEWYLPPDSLKDASIPMLLLAGERDLVAPLWHSKIVIDRVPERSRVTLQVVEGAGHYSFLSPFPPEMRKPTFAPSTDPEGFDRDAFHTRLPELIRSFLHSSLNVDA